MQSWPILRASEVCAFHFCKNCHRHIYDSADIKVCDCRMRKARRSRILSASSANALVDLEEPRLRSVQQLEAAIAAAVGNGQAATESVHARNYLAVEKVVSKRSPKKFSDCGWKFRPNMAIAVEKFDITGLFFWCEPRSFADSELSLDAAKSMNFENHVVLCLFGEPNSPRLGLRKFIMPLRASNRHCSELMPIVIVGFTSYITAEWQHIRVFPGIYTINESPMNRNALRACNIDKCRMCVIVSARKKETDPILMDRHAILSYLNIKAMKFDDFISTTFDKTGPSAQAHMLQKARIIDRSPLKLVTNQTQIDKSDKLESAAPIIANTIPIIADVFVQENVLVLDDDVTHTTQTPLQLMNPFACGNVFAGDVLNNVTGTAFYSPSTANLVREMVTGGNSTETERMIAEGLGLIGSADEHCAKASRRRARVSEFFLSDAAYEEFSGRESSFEKLFIGVLHKFGYVCLGVCRLRDWQNAGEQAAKSHDRRMVVLFPKQDFRLHPTDTVLCLKPFNP